MTRTAYSVAVGWAQGGNIQAWTAFMTSEELNRVHAMLQWLCKLGHLASFSCGPANSHDILADVRARLGDLITDAVWGCPAGEPEPAPSYLVPVWAFDTEEEGYPASTCRFLGVDAQL